MFVFDICKFIVGVPRFVVGTLHPLAPACLQAWLRCQKCSWATETKLCGSCSADRLDQSAKITVAESKLSVAIMLKKPFY